MVRTRQAGSSVQQDLDDLIVVGVGCQHQRLHVGSEAGLADVWSTDLCDISLMSLPIRHRGDSPVINMHTDQSVRQNCQHIDKVVLKDGIR